MVRKILVIMSCFFALSMYIDVYAEQRRIVIPIVLDESGTPSPGVSDFVVSDYESMFNFAIIESFFSMSKDKILSGFGDKYRIVDTHSGGRFYGYYEGYFYHEYGLCFIFSYDDSLAWINIYEPIRINGAYPKMSLSQIQEHLGKAELIKAWYEVPDYEGYYVEYLIGKCRYRFMSLEEDGSNAWIASIYLDDSKTNVLSEEDFDINYNGILINNRRPFTEIAEDLGINLNSYPLSHNSNIYTLSYPNGDNKELQIDFAVLESGESWIIGVELNVDYSPEEIVTNRGIGIWYDELDMLDAYDGLEKFVGFIFPYDASGFPGRMVFRYGLFEGVDEFQDMQITFHVSLSNFQVHYIWINYAFISTVESLGAYFYWH